MAGSGSSGGNVKEGVPLYCVPTMEQALRYYINGLGFTIENKWVVDGKVRWRRLALGGGTLMLQEFAREDTTLGPPKESWRRCFALVSMRRRHRDLS